jgi:hypothetical protein
MHLTLTDAKFTANFVYPRRCDVHHSLHRNGENINSDLPRCRGVSVTLWRDASTAREWAHGCPSSGLAGVLPFAIHSPHHAVSGKRVAPATCWAATHHTHLCKHLQPQQLGHLQTMIPRHDRADVVQPPGNLSARLIHSPAPRQSLGHCSDSLTVISRPCAAAIP